MSGRHHRRALPSQDMAQMTRPYPVVPSGRSRHHLTGLPDGLRVDRAKQLLAADELTMAEVARAAG